MSTASKYFFDPVEHFFGAVLALLGGSSNPAVADVQTKASALGSSLLAAVPTLATELVNAGLATLGPVGVASQPILDLIIQEAATILLAKHSSPATAAAAVAAALPAPAPQPAPQPAQAA